MHQKRKKRSIVENSSKYVNQLFNEKLPGWAVYHDLTHTIETVNACLEIGRASGLTDDDLEILCIAAWFHDTGYMFTVEGHEEKSSELASKFLRECDYPDVRIHSVIDCIMATKIMNIPKNLMEAIIRDSDLISLGNSEYLKKNDLLKKEIEMRENKTISEIAWLKRSLNFLSSHTYFTDYAKQNFNPQLKLNLKILQKKIDEYNF